MTAATTPATDIDIINLTGKLKAGLTNLKPSDRFTMERCLYSLIARIHQEREKAGWQPIETAPKDGTRFLAAEPEDGWIIGLCRWCKTPHVPIYGFHFTDGDPENWEIANPTHWQFLPTPPSLSQEERT